MKYNLPSSGERVGRGVGLLVGVGIIVAVGTGVVELFAGEDGVTLGKMGEEHAANNNPSKYIFVIIAALGIFNFKKRVLL